MGAISITIRRQRRLTPYVLTALFMLWVYGLLWWAVLAAITAAAAWQAWRTIEQRRTDIDAVRARADLQHNQVMSGDDRGVYGVGYNDWAKFTAT